jgi:putative zinc finger/helix-turn-helix YgiT family protein
MRVPLRKNSGCCKWLRSSRAQLSHRRTRGDSVVPTDTSDFVVNQTVECPACGSREVKSSVVEQEFDYGDSKKPVKLRAMVPTFSCSSCELEFTDQRAEQLRHEAVCRHLHVLTPHEIYSIRSERRLTRQRFAELTRLGVATLARWESGEIIQNAALDGYLRLIARPEVFALLETGALLDSSPTLETDVHKEEERFPTLRAGNGISVAAKRARSFRLAA